MIGGIPTTTSNGSPLDAEGVSSPGVAVEAVNARIGVGVVAGFSAPAAAAVGSGCDSRPARGDVPGGRGRVGATPTLGAGVGDGVTLADGTQPAWTSHWTSSAERVSSRLSESGPSPPHNTMAAMSAMPRPACA